MSRTDKSGEHIPGRQGLGRVTAESAVFFLWRWNALKLIVVMAAELGDCTKTHRLLTVNGETVRHKTVTTSVKLF